MRCDAKAAEAPNVPEMIRLHLTAKPRRLRDVTSGLASPVEELVMRMLEYDPVQK